MRHCELTEMTEIGEKNRVRQQAEVRENDKVRGNDKVRENAEVRQQAEVRDLAEGDPSGTDAATEAEGPPYLRFVVQIRPQPPKADGSATGSERSSRAR
jgi:hypothetical protein